MKKLMALCLVLVFVFSVVGCKKTQKESNKSIDETPKPAVCYSMDGTVAYDLTNKEIEYIINVLNNAEWGVEGNLPNCTPDIEMYLQNKELKYHINCAIFEDTTNHRCATITKEQRDTINKMLGVEATN